jgi:hypothetical protein
VLELVRAGGGLDGGVAVAAAHPGTGALTPGPHRTRTRNSVTSASSADCCQSHGQPGDLFEDLTELTLAVGDQASISARTRSVCGFSLRSPGRTPDLLGRSSGTYARVAVTPNKRDHTDRNQGRTSQLLAFQMLTPDQHCRKCGLAQDSRRDDTVDASQGWMDVEEDIMATTDFTPPPAKPQICKSCGVNLSTSKEHLPNCRRAEAQLETKGDES